MDVYAHPVDVWTEATCRTCPRSLDNDEYAWDLMVCQYCLKEWYTGWENFIEFGSLDLC